MVMFNSFWYVYQRVLPRDFSESSLDWLCLKMVYILEMLIFMGTYFRKP